MASKRMASKQGSRTLIHIQTTCVALLETCAKKKKQIESIRFDHKLVGWWLARSGLAEGNNMRLDRNGNEINLCGCFDKSQMLADTFI